MQEQICVVGHSQFFSHLTATEWPVLPTPFTDGEGKLARDSQLYDYSQAPTKFKWLQNCEFYSFDKYMESLEEDMTKSQDSIHSKEEESPIWNVGQKTIWTFQC